MSHSAGTVEHDAVEMRPQPPTTLAVVDDNTIDIDEAIAPLLEPFEVRTVIVGILLEGN